MNLRSSFVGGDYMSEEQKNTPPAQQQKKQPGIESKMNPKPEYFSNDYQGSNKLKNKVALITGGDSGIGRAVSFHFANVGCNVVIIYLTEFDNTKNTYIII